MANVTLKATSRFSTSITVNGDRQWQDWQEGDVRPVPAAVAALLLREVPGCVKVVKAEQKAQPKVETSAGATEKAETRQVTAAPKRTRKTKKDK